MKVDLPPGPQGSAQARRAVREACRDAAIEVNDVVLCASELVTNAFLHGRPPIELEVRVNPKSVWVAVHDSGSGTVELRRPATPDTIAGRGLHIVDRLAARWGSSTHDRGTTIWFEIEGQ